MTTPVTPRTGEAGAADAPGLPRPALAVANALRTILTVIVVAWVAELPRTLGYQLYTEQLLAAALACTFAIVFLCRPADRGARNGLPWYDAAFAAIGFATGAYLAAEYPRIAEDFFYLPTETLVVGTLLVVLTVETLRRSTGWSMVLIFALFLLYALFADLVPGRLHGRAMELGQLLRMLGLDNSALLGRPLVIATTIVVCFILMGQLLLKSGGSAFFTDLAAASMGRSRGGSAKIAIVASGLFGSISGSAVSNVVSTGVITIPLMKRGGYSPHVSGAIEAVASTGGQIMPPIMGAAAFLMAEFLQVPYTDVILAALVPAVLYYVAVFIQTDLEAARSGIAAVPESEIPRLVPVLRSGWYFPLPFVVLIVLMFQYNMPPELAALYAAGLIIVCSVIFGYRGRRLGPGDLVRALSETGATVADIIAICATAGMIIGILNLSGLGFALTLMLVQYGGGALFLLLVVSGVVCIVLGMSLPTVSLYVLLAVLVAPPLIQLGVEPMAAHMFVLYFGLMSMITPPVALCAFAAANLAGADPMRTGFTAMRLGWTAYIVPFLFVYSPSLLLIGEPGEVALAVVTAMAGVWLASIGFIGYFGRVLGAGSRVAFAAAGVGLLVPARAFEGALYLEILGALLAALLIGLEITRRRRSLAAG